MYVLESGRPLAQFTIDYLIAEDPLVKIFNIQSPGLQSGASDGWLNYDLAVAKVPSLYSVREACVWFEVIETTVSIPNGVHAE